MFSQGGNASTNQVLQLGFRANNRFTSTFWGNDLDVAATTTDFNWHHYLCTYDYATNSRKVYKDGTLAGSDTANGAYTGSGAVAIGRLTRQVQRLFCG